MDITVDFKAFQDKVTASLVEATRTAGQIAGQDLSFHRSANAQLSKDLDAQNGRLLRLTNKLIQAATKDSSVNATKLHNQDNVEDNWRSVVDIIDDLLEKADASLDEFSGVLKRLSPSRQDVLESAPHRHTERPQKIPMIYSNTNIRKPQLDFQRQVNNYENTPFKPLLRTKPHALIPLEEAIAPGEDRKYKHPYALEIQSLAYPPTIFKSAPPKVYTAPAVNAPVFVDTEEAVEAMIAELKLAKEIAIDLEHHDTHSYVGIVSLMQISTRDKDWIVDTLKPWRENLQILNEVFTDPSILKVFHGSSMDIIWLQRDLGLYVVGLFDTFHASVALEFPKKSLAYLLERFANVHAQKKYQLADWRIRPLPAELIDYARSDTHYLLYIYDCLREMLIGASTPNENLIDRVLSGSRREALQTYERPIYDPENGLGPVSWFKPLMQRSIKFDNQQFAVFRALHEWRDQRARALDEGEQHIMTIANLWTLAEQMPTSVLEVHKVLRSVPRFISENAKEMVAVIKKAKVEGLNGPSVRDVIRSNEEKFGVSGLWNRKPRTPAQDPHRGLGQTMQMLTTNGELGGPNTPPVALGEDRPTTRSSSSLLWGSSLPQDNSPDRQTVTAAVAALQSILPLAVLAPTTFSSSPLTAPEANIQPVVAIDPSAVSTSTPTADITNTGAYQHDEAFVITEMARQKKRKASEEQGFNAPDLPPLPAQTTQYSDIAVAANGTPPMPHNPILEERLRKTAEKRAKKEARLVKAQAEQAQLQAAKPFDYASAESILHAKSDPVIGVRNSAGKKPMNPFAKALDTTTGAKRLKQGKEQAGKSMTFKS